MTKGMTCYERDEVLCEDLDCLRNDCKLKRSSAESAGLPFQKRVVNWLMACFSMEVCRDGIEHNHRFLEEALELVQSLECTRSEAHQLVDYVFNRPVGKPRQELGGTLVTLTALANCHDMDMMEAGETELARVWTKIDKIRAKHAAKPKHSPLPQHVPNDAQSVGMREALIKTCCASSDGTYVHAPMDDVLRAIAAQLPAAPVDNQSLAQAMYAEGYAAAKAELAPAAPVETKEPEFDPSEWEQIIEDREDALQRSSAGNAEEVLNGIRDALESRGYFHMANGRDIGVLLDQPQGARK